MDMIKSVLAFFVVFSTVVFVHEMGHFSVAKLFGLRVFEFGMGFGPKLFGKKRNGTSYTVNLIPFGGYVKIAGMEEEDDENVPEDESFKNLHPLKKIAVIVAGPMMNIISTVIILFLVFMLIGMPSGPRNKIQKVFEDSAAQQVGLQVGDLIESVNDYKVGQMVKAIEIINKSNGKPLFLGVRRGADDLKINVVARKDEGNDNWYLGIVLASKSNIRYNPLAAMSMAIKETVSYCKMVVFTITSFFSGKVPLSQVSGPVGIAQMTGEAAKLGFMSVIGFLCFINVYLGFFNMIPFPALDGGRIAFLIIESIAGRNLISIKKENIIHYGGFLLLITIMVLVTYQDILRLIK
jgi:regulator of sigma E protease